MRNMKVSVLIPTHKPNPLHLTETLESLRAQTETDWECIICDEPTEVDTHAMIMEYLVDDRITFSRNEKPLGIGGNWNQCLQKASAPLQAFLFQDDVWEPKYLETALGILEKHHTVGFVSMNHRYQHDEDLWTKDGYELLDKIKEKVLRKGIWKKEEFLKMWLERNMHPNLIGEPSFVVMRKSLTEKVGPFDENMVQFLDVEYWLRCLQESDWYYEDSSQGAFRIHGSAASFQNNSSGNGLYDRLTCYERLIKMLRGPMKQTAIVSRNRSLEDMIKKFLVRVKGRKGLSSKGKGQVIRFALCHPFVTTKAFVKVLWRRMLFNKKPTQTPASNQ